MPTPTEGMVLRHLTTPRAAAWAGVVFAVLFGVGLVLFRTSIPAHPMAEPDWAHTRSGRVKTALTLMPLAGIAFLWFVGVVRDRLGPYEDRFLSSVFFGSALLFLAMVFASSAIAGAILLTAQGPHGSDYDASIRFGRSIMLQINNVYALRMAGAFMISLGTIWLRTGLMSRWLVGLTYLLALTLLVVTTLSPWTTLVFPGWVFLVGVLFLIRSHTVAAEEAASGDGR